MRFPITDLLDKQECYNFLLQALHPDGLKYPEGHPLPLGQTPHDYSRTPVVSYRCRICGRVYNLFANCCSCVIHQAIIPGTMNSATTILFRNLYRGGSPKCTYPRCILLLYHRNPFHT
jgi:hypothetical protein